MISGKSDFSAITTLMGDALAQFSKLFQNEVDLAKAEFGQKAQQVGVAAGFLAGAAVLVIPALVMVLFALSEVLVEARWSPAAAHLLSGLVAVIIAGVLAAVGMQRLKPDNLRPSETISQLEQDKAAVKGFVR